MFSSDYWKIEPVPVMGGSCNEIVEEVVPDPQWGVVWTACGGATVDEACGAGSICAPVPSLPLQPNVCIHRNGVHDCPEGSMYSQRLEYYAGIGDTRGCTTCSCGDPEGFCTGNIRTFQTGNCTAPLTNQFTINGNCQQGSSGSPATANFDSDGPQDPTCPANGGEPEGSTTPILPRTFFCCVE